MKIIVRSNMINLKGKKVLITGSARRIGKELALASAKAGADVILHHNSSPLEAAATATGAAHCPSKIRS